MRIIAGAFRGRRMVAPPGRGTRPMLDRVREALFSTLTPWLADATVLDLFAGSGSLGLEALSRGARRVRFVERSASALAALRKNVELLGVRDRVEIVTADALAVSSWLAGARIAFVDPPYALLDERRRAVLSAVERLVTEYLAEDGIAMLHVPHGALAEADLAWARARVRRYGTNALWYLERRQSTPA
jgi:16S rRNA (guanine966-N2)-methyltransferase